MFQSLQQLKSCHMCQSVIDQSVFFSCTNKPLCNKHYCISCIKKHFSGQSSPELFKISTWLCYSCQSKCQCQKCTNKKSGDSMFKFSLIDLNGSKPSKNEKKNASKKTIRFHIPDEVEQKQKDIKIFDLQQESQEYIAPSFLKAMQKPSKNITNTPQVTNQHTPTFEVLKQESMTPLDYSSEVMIGNERKSKTIIKCKKQRNFVGLKVDRIPPYLESIMRRKQVFRSFMIRHSKKSYEQLVREQYDKIEEENRNEFKAQIFERVEFPSPVMKPPSINSNTIIDNLFTPGKVPETPSFVPLSEPMTPIPNAGKIAELLHEQLKEYEMEDDDLSIELL